MDPRKQTWFITGCSSGFGEQFVRQLRALGDNVIATGRNAETKLAHLKDTGATILELDVTAPQAELDAKFQQAVDIYGGVDVLVNNAGYIQCGAIEEMTPEDMERCFATNFHGPINLTRAALPHFRSKGEKGEGRIIYMGSQAGFYGEPAAAAYCASKHALEGAVESLSKELALFAPGIKPLIIEAGIHSTEVMDKINHVPNRVEFWRPLNEAVRARGAENYRNEPGNAVELIAKVIQLAKGVGIAEGKEVPLRVPFGSECLDILREKIRALTMMVEEWEEVARSTDFPDRQGPPPALPS
ncbi:SDR family oxidoreductase [Aspergillus homomorphus CBS 101889]|uniref:Hydroxybutyrate dehydrogenase n=1 Tax=Aspergillus homomorphus (strain CBS 101889) TaxID=1450537 RepID=A0A395I828_ASPHC|nr:hydroxybutyrate dehydrogenase [Aspergillus homomorphus CBS 101889]RAL15218.1 hydroxybutyrate dehydrogenase [Aspergillus homomorphus CBS 101889]